MSNAAVVRRLLALSWRYRRGCVEVLVYQLILLAMGLAGLGLTGLGIDFIRQQVQTDAKPPHWPWGLSPPDDWKPMAVISCIAVAVMIFALLRAVLNYFYSMAVARLVEQQIVVHLRAQVYDKLQRLSFRFFDANASGSIINRVTGDTRAVVTFVNGVVIQSVIMLLSLGVYLVYMLNIHVLLTVACLATTPLLWVISTKFSRLVQPQYARNRDLFDRMILSLSETVQGIQVIKGFARETEQVAMFDTANCAVTEQQQSIFRRVSAFTPLIGLIAQLNLVVLVGYGGWLVIHDQLPLGAGLIVCAGLLQQFSGQVANVANVANTIQQSLIGARRVFEVLDAPVEITSPPNATPVARAGGHVQFERVCFEFKTGEPVLEEIEFEIKPGQCVAILGASGAGKSALLSLIPRFYDPTRGCVRLDGHDLRTLDLDDLRRNIGLVFQESFLFSNTVAANIAFGHPFATQEQIKRAAKIAASHEFILQLPKGYETVLGEAGADLSGGQRQRLAIARAVLLEPSILLMDDPTAAIDPQTEQEILAALDNAMAGRTTLIVAHRLSTLRRAQVILVMEKGRIVQRGSHEELINVPGPYRDAALAQLSMPNQRVSV